MTGLRHEQVGLGHHHPGKGGGARREPHGRNPEVEAGMLMLTPRSHHPDSPLSSTPVRRGKPILRMHDLSTMVRAVLWAWCSAVTSEDWVRRIVGGTGTRI